LRTVGVARAPRARRRPTDARAIGAAGVGVAVVPRIVDALVALGTRLSGEAATAACFLFADTNATTVGAAVIRIAVIFGIVNAREAGRAWKTSNPTAETRSGAGVEDDAAHALSALCTRAGIRPIGAQAARRSTSLCLSSVARWPAWSRRFHGSMLRSLIDALATCCSVVT
jgi:hypothetical protein